MKYKVKCTNVLHLMLNIYGSNYKDLFYDEAHWFILVKTQREAELIEKLYNLRATETELYNLIVEAHKNNK